MNHQVKKTENKGATLLLLTVLFTAASVTILLGTISPIVRQLQVARDFESSKKSYFAAEAGSEDAFYRMKNNLAIIFPLDMEFDGADVNVTSSIISETDREITAEAVESGNYRTVLKGLTVSNGFSFHYGIQTGVGGLYLYNNARVNGNVYSNGVILGGNTNPNSYNFIDGAAIAAGPAGSIRYVNASSSAYAHSVRDAIVGGDAYYQSISNATVAGTLHPDSPDPAVIDFPITDEIISDWEEDAESGGLASCVGGIYMTLTGNIWVTGNITITGSGGSGVQVRVDDSVGNKSVVMIADNPSNKNGSGQVAVSGNSNFYGSTGNDESYVMLLSANQSAENGGSNLAIDIVNGAAGNVLVYAPHGEIRLQNNVNLREVTSYKLSVYNNAVVNYLIGLAQPLFTSGPGGTWKLKRWKEVQ
ncbi:MAG: hypothetical protein UY54_C0026G0007 [Parcubacteria group bacterium GW2011_GWA2_50_10b]|nr:MAG: hypothetical protein UY54_C0026G0007 [Parcubacteria group bacterium GW2011_GWA2_50_10b]